MPTSVSVQYKVRLDYFNDNGKWKYSGDYMTSKRHLFEIWDEIRAMLKTEKPMPGITNTWKSHILVTVPGHPNDHPHLIVGEPV